MTYSTWIYLYLAVINCRYSSSQNVRRSGAAAPPPPLPGFLSFRNSPPLPLCLCSPSVLNPPTGKLDKTPRHDTAIFFSAAGTHARSRVKALYNLHIVAPLSDAREICIIHKRRRKTYVRGIRRYVSRDNPNRRRAICERARRTSAALNFISAFGARSFGRECIIYGDTSRVYSRRDAIAFEHRYIKGGGQCEATHNLFRARGIQLSRETAFTDDVRSRTRISSLPFVPSECTLRDARCTIAREGERTIPRRI